MFRLIQKSNPRKYHKTQKTSFLLGRSKQCDIIISDPKISDVQAKVGTKDNRYFIKNLGSDKISVNGQPTEGQFIKNGDELALGNSKFVVQMAEKERPEPKLPLPEDKTMVLDTPSEETLGPRLVCTTAAGKSKIIFLKREKLIIGRSNEAALKLMHPSISRKHCIIEKQDKGYVARNISTTNPLYLNDQVISEQRLYSGDQLRMGPFSITFISDQPTDARQTTQKIVTPEKGSNWSLWLTAALILTFSVYLLYMHTYMPWKAQQKLAGVAGQIARIEAAVRRTNPDWFSRLPLLGDLPLLASGTEGGRTVPDLTESMYQYHDNLRAEHAASSPWWATSRAPPTSAAAR